MPTSLCQTHGLGYDPEVATGCARCRAEDHALEARTARRTFLAAGATGVALTAAAFALRPHVASAAPAAAPVSELSDIVFGGRYGALFEPAGLAVSVACPLLLPFDPGGDARGVVQRYSRAARLAGWLAASCSEVRNGTGDAADTDAMMDLLAFVNARRKVDSSRVFAGGMSGGACGAYRLAIVRSDVVHGAIVECGHMAPWREVGARATSALRFYLFTRENDFNRPATRTLRDAMAARGCRVTEVESPGGHTPMGDQEIEAAVRWMGEE